MVTKKRSASSAPLFGVILAGVATLAYAAGPGGWFESDVAVGLEGAVVRHGPLRISVVEKGNLESANSVSLKSEVEGRPTILWLIEEGTMVQPGDLLCELDTSQIEDELFEQELDVESARAGYKGSLQNLKIQESQNQSDVATAERKLEFARLDKTKYLEGDHKQERAQLHESIKLAEAQLLRDENELKWSNDLFEAGFLTKTELDADKLTVDRSVIERDRAVRALDLLDLYDHPRKLAELDADIVEAVRELERVVLQAAARLADQEFQVSSDEKTLQLEQAKLTEWREQINLARVTAPVAGMVVYGRDRDSRWGDGEPIKEGAEIRERQEIIQIPVTEGMIAEASLHESVVDQVKQGQAATMTFDALPGRVFQGVVRFKAQLPDKNSWWANQNMRLYRTEVEVLDPNSEMRPGLTCSIEILVDDIAACTYVPVQSVFLDAGQTTCFVRTDGGVEKRPVETARSNYKWVEITSGVTEGEIVLLSQPPGFTLEPAVAARADELTPPPLLQAGSPVMGERGRSPGAPGGRPATEGTNQGTIQMDGGGPAPGAGGRAPRAGGHGRGAGGPGRGAGGQAHGAGGGG